jgi:hypothetical protein
MNPKKMGRPKGQKNETKRKKPVNRTEHAQAMEFPEVLVFIGFVIEFLFEDDEEGYSYRWDPKDKKILATDPMGKKLFIFSKVASSGHIKAEGSDLLAAERTFKGFHFQNSKDKKTLSIENSGFATSGKALSIRYVSDREGKPKSYFHQFTSSPKVMSSKKGKDFTFVINGVKLKISTEGIRG